MCFVDFLGVPLQRYRDIFTFLPGDRDPRLMRTASLRGLDSSPCASTTFHSCSARLPYRRAPIVTMRMRKAELPVSAGILWIAAARALLPVFSLPLPAFAAAVRFRHAILQPDYGDIDRRQLAGLGSRRESSYGFCAWKLGSDGYQRSRLCPS